MPRRHHRTPEPVGDLPAQPLLTVHPGLVLIPGSWRLADFTDHHDTVIPIEYSHATQFPVFTNG